MGHERIGVLPKTKRWLDIVEEFKPVLKDEVNVSNLARMTLENVKARFGRIHQDSGVQAAFGFLIALAANERQSGKGMAGSAINLGNNPSLLEIINNLNVWIEQHRSSLEYAEIAKRAAADAIAYWTRSQLKQRELFNSDEKMSHIWRQASSGAGFSDVSRVFFAKFTERYLKYFLEREASAHSENIVHRMAFEENLHDHIDEISRYAFETSRIAQSFAAGWYNKHTREGRPSDQEISGFLAVAFGKIREELMREGIKRHDE